MTQDSNVGARGLGEQQQAAGPEDAVKLRERFLLLNEMMECLVAEDDGHALARQVERGNVSLADLDRQLAANRICGRNGLRVDVEADDSLGREALDERPEGFTPAAARVGYHRPAGSPSRRDQALEIVERDADDPRLPDLRAEKPKSRSVFRGRKAAYAPPGVESCSHDFAIVVVVAAAIVPDLDVTAHALLPRNAVRECTVRGRLPGAASTSLRCARRG